MRLLARSARTPEDVIAAAKVQLGRQPRILDFGVGYGRLAIPRLLAGHDIYGVDVDEDLLARGRRSLEEAGLEPHRFQLLRDGSSTFPAGYFDVIYSEDVLEHVRDYALEDFVTEIRRLTAPSGVGVHLYPGRYRVIEGHLRMPLIQWLPRNSALRVAILAFTALGVEPVRGIPGVPVVTPDQGKRERAELYYHWLLEHTFYRPRGDVERLFDATGLIVTSPRSRLLSALTHEYIVTSLQS